MTSIEDSLHSLLSISAYVHECKGVCSKPVKPVPFGLKDKVMSFVLNTETYVIFFK